MLLSRLALPTSDAQRSQNILNFVADLDLCSIADEFGRGSSVLDNVFERVDKLFVRLHSVDVGDERFCSDKELSTCNSRSGRRGIGIDRIRGDTQKIIYRSHVRSALDKKALNLRLDPLNIDLLKKPPIRSSRCTRIRDSWNYRASMVPHVQ